MTRSAWILVLFGLWLPALATAQDPTPGDVRSAAAAFGEGQNAQLRGDYAEAADLFELADRSAPNAAALRSAIRNRRAASQSARAATLAAEALARYPDDEETHALAEATLTELAPTLAAVHVTCTPACSLAIDGRAAHQRSLERFEVFVEPGSHQLAASWGTGTPITRELAAVAAEETSIAFEEPLEQQEAEEEEQIARATPTGETLPAPAPANARLHPALFGAVAGLAVVGLGITIWSGVDTLEAAGAYRRLPTAAGYNDGIGRELRTNVLIGATAAVAATALVLVIFTDFDGDGSSTDDVALLPGVFVSPEGASAVLSGAF